MAASKSPSDQSTATAASGVPQNDWPQGTIRIGRYNMHLNVKKFFFNALPFIIMALWRFHFGQIYFWFPTRFASQYHPGWECSTITVPGGGMCEDVVQWKEKGLAIMTCDSNRRKWNTVMGPLDDPNPKGQLILVDYTTKPAIVETLNLGMPESDDFHPLGGAFFHDKYHSTFFVTNARRNQSTIEVFHVSHSKPPKFTWHKTVSHSQIRNANAILPVSSTQFYVTNDHRFRRAELKFAHMFETYSQLPLSYTTFMDFSLPEIKAETAVWLQRIANGIAATPDLERVFIAESGRGGFGVYARTRGNKLDFLEFVSINGFTDNLHFNADGYIDKDNWGNSAIIAGAHPNVLRLVQFAKGVKNAPSWIVSVRYGSKEGGERDPKDRGLYVAKNYKEMWTVKTEVQDDGEWFGGATGGFVDGERGVLLGTGLYDAKGAFVCQKK